MLKRQAETLQASLALALENLSAETIVQTRIKTIPSFADTWSSGPSFRMENKQYDRDSIVAVPEMLRPLGYEICRAD